MAETKRFIEPLSACPLITDSQESGVASIDVMKQAGHHDLRITTKYANHEDKKLASKMYEKGLKFGKKE